MMGGEITVTSEVSVGSTFRVELPVSPPRHHHAGNLPPADSKEEQHA
jgi:hypothetical protein